MMGSCRDRELQSDNDKGKERESSTVLKQRSEGLPA